VHLGLGVAEELEDSMLERHDSGIVGTEGTECPYELSDFL
jgi:hypothetical protein